MKFSKYISYIFHPIVFPIIGTLLYFIFLPRHINKQFEHSILFATFVSTYIIPVSFMFLLKKIKIINSIHIESIEERRFPLLLFTILSGVFGILLYKNQIIMELALFYFGMAFALLIAYGLLFLKFKASLHTLGIGALIGFLGVFSFAYQLNLILILIVLFIVSGVIATSRLKLNAHTSKEIYTGFFIGIVIQVSVFYVFLVIL